MDACAVDEDCPGAQRCDQNASLCAEADRCGVDVDCQGDRVCDGAVCHAPCLDDEDCGGGLTCELATGHCLEPHVCRLDGDCGGLRVCAPGGACFEPECAVNADCAGACVDRLCAAGPPVRCSDEDDCPGPPVCAPLGACVLDGLCGGDEECPAGAPICDAPAGRCVACTPDAGCTPTELCEEGTCHYHGGCGGDEDCPGTRTCDTGDCLVEPGCEGDAFDLDPEPPELLPRTYTGLVLCDGTEDVYPLEVPAGEGLQVVLRHAPEDGDLSLTVRDGERAFIVLGRSDRPLGLEVVAVGAALDPQPLEVVVRGRLGFSVPYSLTLESLPADACPPDVHEGLLGNDDAGHATDVGAGEHGAELCPGDEDWFALDLSAGSRVTVRATPGLPAGRLAVSLLAPAGGVLVEAEREGEAVEVAADAATPGPHLVQVRSPLPDARIPFTLQVVVEAAAAAEALACDHPAPLEPNRPFTFPSSLPVRRFAVSCGDAFSTDYLASFELAVEAEVALRVQGAQAISLRSDCAAPGSEVACSAGLDPGLEGLQLDIGTWYVVVQPFDVLPPVLTVERRQRCAADGDCDEGSVCDGLLCHLECALDDDCPGAQTCADDGTGHCEEPAVCQAPEDCLGMRDCRWDGGCFLPDCEDNADCGGACVDRSCAAAPPAACEDEDDCPGLPVCAPVGACALDQPCGADGDCPDGSPYCVAAEGRCVGCRSDDDCAPVEACGGDRCRYVGGCEQDPDCPGDRVCNDLGDCEPAGGCEGDRFDDAPGAVLERRTYGGLLLCDGTTDAYSVGLPAGEGLRAVLRHPPADGDLSLTLEDATPPLQQLAYSDQRHGVEVVGVEPAQQARDLNVVVRGRPGSSVAYSLTLERPEGDACAPDGLEGPFGNGDADHATPIGVGDHEHVLCPGDEDWFALDVQAGTHLTVRSQLPLPGSPVALTLLGPAGQPPVEGAEDGGLLLAEVDVGQPGRHLVHVRTTQPATSQRLRLSVAASAAGGAEGLACEHPLPLVPGDVTMLPRALPVSRFAFSCVLIMPGLNADHLLSFHLDQPATVTLEVLRGAEAVAIRSDCDDVDSEEVCGLADDPDLQGMALGDGTWFVLVEGLAGQRPEVRLTLE